GQGHPETASHSCNPVGRLEAGPTSHPALTAVDSAAPLLRGNGQPIRNPGNAAHRLVSASRVPPPCGEELE
ncbi:MAG: hypothetical protein RBU37_21070, partial [Myxococcota bacterium]|nr:hypothetical protein [Myxococcota bacterium]